MKTNLWYVWCRAEKRSTVNVLHMGMRDFCVKVNQILAAAVESRPYSVTEGILWVSVRFMRETKGHTCSVVFQGHALRIEAWMMISSGAGSSGDRSGRRCVWKPRGNVGVFLANSSAVLHRKPRAVNGVRSSESLFTLQKHDSLQIVRYCVAKWVFVQSCKIKKCLLMCFQHFYSTQHLKKNISFFLDFRYY